MKKRAREERVYEIGQLPRKNSYEIALIGRSNVGKSSLLNKLVGYSIAQVSQRPGCTMWLGIHNLDKVTLVDLPGYGYAKSPESRRKIVNELVMQYFDLERTDRVLLLVDSRRGLMEVDKEMLEFFGSKSVAVTLVGTKADKKHSAKEEYDFITSSKYNTGIKELKEYILNLPSSISW